MCNAFHCLYPEYQHGETCVCYACLCSGCVTHSLLWWNNDAMPNAGSVSKSITNLDRLSTNTAVHLLAGTSVVQNKYDKLNVDIQWLLISNVASPNVMQKTIQFANLCRHCIFYHSNDTCTCQHAEQSV